MQKKKKNSFILVYFNYLFISCIQKKNNSFILVYFCQWNFFYSKKVVFFCTNAIVHEMSKMLYKCSENEIPSDKTSKMPAGPI